MDLIPYLSAIILIATITTIVLATFSYAAFKLRDRRRPKRDAAGPVFFRSFELEEDEAEHAGGATERPS